MLFRKLGIVTIAIIYLLILAGGIVRSTGSGMGCPDWPKCFGTWVPPTDASQLPANYQEVFGAKLKGEVVFNVYKTWTEYINRLLGVLTGFAIFATLLAAIPFLKKDKPIFYLSLLGFLLVGFQGWLGSKVVSTELSPVIVTLHMLLAIVIVFVLLYAIARSYSTVIIVEVVKAKRKLNWLFVTAIGLSLIQVLIGTQVRETIDEIIRQIGGENRVEWIENLGLIFYIHRSFSLLVLAVHIYLIYQLRKNSQQKGILHRFTTILLVMVLVEIGSGIIMAYWGIPAFVQPIHLTLAIVIVGIQFVAMLLLNASIVFQNRNSQAFVVSV